MNEFVFPRYIKREDAQKVLCGWCGICQDPTLEDLEKCDDICPQFAQIPNGDVRPVVRGEWSKIDYEPCGHDYICSACEMKNSFASLYCPNCGADMRGGGCNG